MKLFTLDDRLVQRQAGMLAAIDAAAVAEALGRLLSIRSQGRLDQADG